MLFKIKCYNKYGRHAIPLYNIQVHLTANILVEKRYQLTYLKNLPAVGRLPTLEFSHDKAKRRQKNLEYKISKKQVNRPVFQLV